jgi:hypothetical protein
LNGFARLQGDGKAPGLKATIVLKELKKKRVVE